ncbi:FecR domain-containing protein [Proteiniphilum sp.]|uniref:FecR family protein n=1 Tax=Proteiniphilum sp. TaxID=1926877 RepID=UPI00332843E6
MDDHIIDLLQRYISGEIRSDEFSELQGYINHTPDKDLIFLLQQQWENQNPHASLYNKNIKKIIRYIKQETAPRKTSVILRFKWFQAGVAALFLLLIGLSIHLYVGKQAYVRLGERDFVMRTGKGERVSMVLPDGTQVRLNSESVLSYQQNFGHSDRCISFTGEGYFEVAKDAEKQFQIQTQYLHVKVLGTTFNLSVYEEDKILELALISGTVEVSTNHEPVQTAQLYPNEKALFDTQTKQLTIAKSVNQNETAWLENKLVFRSEPLKEVLRQIGRQYGVAVEMEMAELEEDRYTGVFDEDLYGVLNILKAHYDFEYKVDKDTLYVTKQK